MVISPYEMDSCLSDNLGTVPLDSVLPHSYVMQNSLSRHATQYNGKLKRASRVITISDESSKQGYDSFEGVLGSLPVNAIFEGPSPIKWRGPSLLRATSLGIDGFLSQDSQHNGQFVRFLEGGVGKVGGLIRSQSCPPEDWQGLSRGRDLRSSKTTQNAIHDREEQVTTLKAIHSPHYVPKAANVSSTDNGDSLQRKGNANRSGITGDDDDDDNADAAKVEPPIHSETGIPLLLERMKACSMSAEPSNLQADNASSTTLAKAVPGCWSPNVSTDQLISCTTPRCCPPSGKMLERGRRKEMEDAVTILSTFSAIPRGTTGMCLCHKGSQNTSCHWNFFGVYDGHGGSQASSYCKRRLHILLADELSSLCATMDGRDDRYLWKEIMMDTFLKIDREVGGVCPNEVCNDDLLENPCSACKDAIAPENVGTTAVVAVVGSCQMVVANCGDSRAVLSRGGKAIPLSTDHKPERADETRRIESAGGRVVYWDGYRVGGFLALSRAIGDRYLKRYVTSEPEVMCIQREEDDECLILASDGLWDVVSNDYACEVARKGLVSRRKRDKATSKKCGEDPASIFVATYLTKLAYSRGSKDNISVIVVDLKR